MLARYGLHADRYRAFRPSYPAWVFDKAVALCGKPTGLALELGAGSGQATPRILERFDRVVAVEPDAAMAALIPRDPRLQVVIGGAETASLPAQVDAAVAATALHWMDAAVVGRRVAEALRPGGVFLAFGYQMMEATGPAAAVRLVEAETELWRPQIHARIADWRPYAELMASSGAFADIEPFGFTLHEERTPQAAAGLFLTTSYAAEHARRSGDEAAYCRDFEMRMIEAAGGGPVDIRYVVSAALGRV